MNASSLGEPDCLPGTRVYREEGIGLLRLKEMCMHEADSVAPNGNPFPVLRKRSVDLPFG